MLKCEILGMGPSDAQARELLRRGKLVVIETHNPPVNALSRQVRDGLVAAATEAANSDARAILLHCSGRTFFSGADISVLDRPLEGSGLLALADACAAAPHPVIAALHGSVLGGGVVVADCVGGPRLAHAAVVQALSWPIWKADLFAHELV